MSDSLMQQQSAIKIIVNGSIYMKYAWLSFGMAWYLELCGVTQLFRDWEALPMSPSNTQYYCRSARKKTFCVFRYEKGHITFWRSLDVVVSYSFLLVWQNSCTQTNQLTGWHCCKALPRGVLRLKKKRTSFNTMFRIITQWNWSCIV